MLFASEWAQIRFNGFLIKFATAAKLITGVSLQSRNARSGRSKFEWCLIQRLSSAGTRCAIGQTMMEKPARQNLLHIYQPPLTRVVLPLYVSLRKSSTTLTPAAVDTKIPKWQFYPLAGLRPHNMQRFDLYGLTGVKPLAFLPVCAHLTGYCTIFNHQIK